MWLKKASRRGTRAEPGLRRDRPPFLYFFIFSAFLNLFFIFFFFQSGNELKESLMSKEVVASIDTSTEDEEFIRKVSEDLGFESEVVMVIGPYFVPSFFSQTQNYRLNQMLSKYPIRIDPDDPTRRILMEESIYNKLPREFRHAALAHEIGHIYFLVKDGPTVAQLDPDFELKADRIAIRYVSPKTLIDLYRQYGSNTTDIQKRIEVLERQIF